jgi:hypothetical protein
MQDTHEVFYQCRWEQIVKWAAGGKFYRPPTVLGVRYRLQVGDGHSEVCVCRKHLNKNWGTCAKEKEVIPVTCVTLDAIFDRLQFSEEYPVGVVTIWTDLWTGKFFFSIWAKLGTLELWNQSLLPDIFSPTNYDKIARKLKILGKQKTI